MLTTIAAGLALTFAASCTHLETKEESGTYACPSCKETVTWTYNHKNMKTGEKVIHECPECKKEWGSNLSVASTCATCNDEHLLCPVCRKHG